LTSAPEASAGRGGPAAFELRSVTGRTAPDDWREFVALCPDATFFHRPVWSDVVCASFSRCRGRWLLVRRGRATVGGMALVESRKGPFRRCAGHFEGTCGDPLLHPGLEAADAQAVASRLIQGLWRLSRRPRTLDLQLFLSQDADAAWRTPLVGVGARRDEISASAIPLDGGPEAVQRRHFHRTRRKERNRALRAGCETFVTEDPGIIAEYHPVYLDSAKRWGVEPLPVELLTDLLAGGRGDAFFCGVRHEGRLIGGHLNLGGGGTVTAWNGTTLADESDKHPATLLIWTDIEEACRRGARRLDLGAHGGLAGVARFKQLFAAEPRRRAHFHLSSPLGRTLLRLTGRDGPEAG